MKRSIPTLVLSSILAVGGLQAADNPSNSKRVQAMLDSLSLEEKIDYIGGFEDFNIRPYPEQGIPAIRMADGPVGVRNYGKSTAYPASIALAASWDREMAQQVGAAIGMEARDKNVHLMLGPGMNIYRMPLCGRNFEYLGEDPYLAGQLATQYIIGMQDQGVMACAKHYVANNQEFDRHHTSSDMDERTLHEIYLPAFKDAVEQGHVATVMTSYNLINGIHASQHDYLINQVLKTDWNFQGFAVSDWVSTYDGIACALGGLDLEMPSARMMTRETLLPAIASGQIDPAIIDDKVARILKTIERFGYLDQADISVGYQLDTEYVRKVALEAARGGLVLLKNEKQSLPLDPSTSKTIAVIGPNAKPAVTGGGGSSTVDPLHPVSFLEAIRQIAGDDSTVIHAPGVYKGTPIPDGTFDKNPLLINKDGKLVPGVSATFYNGKTLDTDQEILSRDIEQIRFRNLDFWSLPGIPHDDFSARFTGTFIPEKDGYHLFAVSGDDGYRLKIDGETVLDAWRDQGDTATAYECQLEAGRKYAIEIEYYQAGGDAILRFGVQSINMPKSPQDLLAEAVDAAKQADLVILSVGFDTKTEAEGIDRSFDLPYDQTRLIHAVTAANPHCTVVLNAGGNVDMAPWIDQVDALLMAWYPGQEGNLAAAEILFGITNPSGKLPASFANKLEDNPCFPYYHDEDQDKAVTYGEGIFLGYRYWDQTDAQPRFPFGFGLSYTSFGYSPIQLDKSNFKQGEPVTFSVTVSNTGERAGAEVVQVYVSDIESRLPRPVKELKDFAKCQLAPGESRELTFTLDAEAFSFYDPTQHAWTLEPGEFEILIGSSSTDIRCTSAITIH